MKLHGYQELGVRFLQNHPRAGLFLDMGLGKTAIVLSALSPEHLPCLVVAPKRVAENTWPEERDLWRPDLSLSLAADGPAGRKAALASDSDIIVLGRDNLKDIPKFRHKFNTLVIDESSGFKSGGNRGSVRWRMANGVAMRTDHCWILSGTPSPNSYQDLWSQIYLLDQGKRLGATLGSFRERWMHMTHKLANGAVMRAMDDGADEDIKKLIQDICLYMESEGRVKLPSLTYNPISFSLSKSTMDFYRSLKKDMVADLKEIGITVSADNSAILSNRLSQISAGFIYETDPITGTREAHDVHAMRIDVVKELVEDLTSPAILVYRYQWEEARLLKLKGARSIREKGVVADWNRGEVPLLVAHPASAGHGLNLQHGGHTIIWCSPVWELELWLQMNKRLHRQGQKHPVIVHKITAKGTIDKMVYDRLEEKDWAQQDLLEHLRSPV